MMIRERNHAISATALISVVAATPVARWLGCCTCGLRQVTIVEDGKLRGLAGAKEIFGAVI